MLLHEVLHVLHYMDVRMAGIVTVCHSSLSERIWEVLRQALCLPLVQSVLRSPLD